MLVAVLSGWYDTGGKTFCSFSRRLIICFSLSFSNHFTTSCSHLLTFISTIPLPVQHPAQQLVLTGVLQTLWRLQRLSQMSLYLATALHWPEAARCLQPVLCPSGNVWCRPHLHKTSHSFVPEDGPTEGTWSETWDPNHGTSYSLLSSVPEEEILAMPQVGFDYLASKDKRMEIASGSGRGHETR